MVWPNVREPIVVAASTVLSTVPGVPTVPGSKNLTSLDEPGEPLGVQFPDVDQFELTPAGVQTFNGLNGAAVAMVTVKVFVTGVTRVAFGGLVSIMTLTTYVFEGVLAVVEKLRVNTLVVLVAG